MLTKSLSDTGMGSRMNTIMQVCFFAISKVLPRDEAIEAIRESIRHTYGRKGEDVVQKNMKAVDETLAHLHEVRVPETVSSKTENPSSHSLALRSSSTTSSGHLRRER